MLKRFPIISAIIILYLGLSLIFGIAIFGFILASIPMLPGIALLCMSDTEIGSKKWIYLFSGFVLAIIGAFCALMIFSLLLRGYH